MVTTGELWAPFNMARMIDRLTRPRPIYVHSPRGRRREATLAPWIPSAWNRYFVIAALPGPPDEAWPAVRRDSQKRKERKKHNREPGKGLRAHSAGPGPPLLMGMG